MTSIGHPQLYSRLHTFIVQTLPDSCDTHLANLLFIMFGLFLARSVQLDRKCPLVQVRAWFDPFVRWTLLSAGSGGVVHLIIDSTKIAIGFRLVMVSVTYRRRNLPIA